MSTPRYRLADITPNGLRGSARDINALGDVLAIVWRENMIQFGIVWHQGNVLELPTVDGESLDVRAMNDDCIIVGAALVNGIDRACLWTNGEVEFLAAKKDSCATDVNNHNAIVGYHTRLDYERPVMWHGNARRLSELRPDFVPLAYSDGAHAFAINDHGVVAGVEESGTYAFIKEQSTYRRIDTLLTDAAIWPSRINNHNMVVGHVIDPDEEYAFLYSKNLDRLPTIAGSEGQAADINDAGVIVGATSYQRGSNELHGTVWHDKRAYDLNEIVTNIGRYTITYASAINDSGQIAASGILQGEHRVLLLTPVT